MDVLMRQQLVPGTSQDDQHLVVKLLQLLSDNGINILEDHKEFLHHGTVTQNKLETSREAEDDSQDKSPLSVFHGSQSKNVDILHIAAAYVDKRTKCGKTPLHLSAEQGHKQIVEILLKAGAMVDVEDKDKQTPLHLSAKNGHKEVVEILLKAGASADVQNSFMIYPLHLSVRYGHKKVAEILLKAGAIVDVEAMHKRTPLHWSVALGLKEVVEILLKAGAAVDLKDQEKKTPLYMSAFKGHTEIVEILLKAGADVNVEDLAKQTPLHLGAKNGYTKMVKILLKAGARVDAVNKNKQTPLLLSLKKKHKDVAEVLISAGASVNIRDIHGDCAVYHIDRDTSFRYPPNPWALGRQERSFSKTESVKSTRTYTSLTTKLELKETISTTFQPIESNNPASVHSSSNKDLNSFRQQVEDHWAKFSPKHREGWETSCSHDVKAAFQAGRIIMHTTFNINNIRKRKIIYRSENLTIKQAKLVPVNSQVIVNQVRTATDDGEGSSSDEDMSQTS